MVKLTPKQFEYVRGLIEGCEPSVAYRKAFDCSTMSTQTIAKKAYGLSKHPLVVAELERAREKLRQNAVWTREMSVSALVQSFGIAKSSQQVRSMIAAVRELNLMYGYHAPTKQIVRTEPDMSELSDTEIKEELARLRALAEK